ncbi:hypothetical protein C0J08_01040 [Marinomonas sp. CT5]|uniref:helix-turn-helix domain-containing protein n=1 Tax=Marinomonas sp. CT5 TaxID=2066133 RepID=UPI001BAED123|nr:helix-turn-helix domain-containing protein [Marinomonas sp. CT5]QUX94071.1 hypothetical protein C0J08_01040 [Marinomonas sp. CT5]
MHSKALQKSKLIMDTINASESGALSLENIHILTQIPKPTVKRLLDDLQDLGVVYRKLKDKQYVVLYSRGQDDNDKYLLARELSPILTQLHKETSMYSDIVYLHRGAPVILESNFSYSNIRSAAERIMDIRFSPLLSAAGRALYSENNIYHRSQQGYSGLNFEQLAAEKACGIYQRIPGSWEHPFPPPFPLAAIALPIRFKQKTVAAINLYWSTQLPPSSQIPPFKLTALHNARNTLEKMLQQESVCRKTLPQLLQQEW